MTNRAFLGNLLDISSPDVGVSIKLDSNHGTLWVDVDGETVLRISKMKALELLMDDVTKHFVLMPDKKVFERALEVAKCEQQTRLMISPKLCSIAYPKPCTHAQWETGSWCKCHWPYRCWCGDIGVECVVYSTFDTDQDRWYCQTHYDDLPEDQK